MIHNSVLLATFLSKKKTKRIYALEVILVPKRGKKLTRHVDVLLAREPDARVKLPHQVLVLARFPDVLDQAGVIEVRTVKPDAKRLSGRDGSRAERLHHLPRALAPVAGGERAHREEQGEEVQGKSQGGSPSPV